MDPQNAAQDNKNYLKDILLPSLIILVVILAGAFTGWKIYSSSFTKSTVKVPGQDTQKEVKKGQEVGSTDTKTFSDEAEGILRDGGVNGEGAYHLERAGGDSQTAALTSSVLDLSEFVGKKVHVWGETQKSTKVGWFMDVGKVKILE